MSARWSLEPGDPRPPALLEGGWPVTATLAAVLVALCILVAMATDVLA